MVNHREIMPDSILMELQKPTWPAPKRTPPYSGGAGIPMVKNDLGKCDVYEAALGFRHDFTSYNKIE